MKSAGREPQALEAERDWPRGPVDVATLGGEVVEDLARPRCPEGELPAPLLEMRHAPQEGQGGTAQDLLVENDQDPGHGENL
jgi:hypothetical protein